MSVIELHKVSKHYDDTSALEDVSFDVDKGEIFGLIGPDGAGKTSLFRILVSVLLPSSGSAMMCGHDVVKDYRKIRTLVGYMPGRFSLYLDLSVEENLNFYATVFGTSIEKNYDLIKDIYAQIEPFRKRRAGNLSGGMKQKLALSCALIHRPEVLVLDEPTTGVDAVSRKEFWDLLYKIRQEGITILVSTPYMDEASRCNRVGLMQKGKILKIDKPGLITKDFHRPLYSVRSTTSNYRLLLKLRDYQWCHSAWLFGQDIHLSLTGEPAVTEFENTARAWDDTGDIHRIEAGVEDTFIELMPSTS
ncbi:MAG TPA: ABC transporter ATP-binding protein [Bacteroidales bacterium]|nr:ABC transporter ATP-binding protein [Bacteroidales bacterium]